MIEFDVKVFYVKFRLYNLFAFTAKYVSKKCFTVVQTSLTGLFKVVWVLSILVPSVRLNNDLVLSECYQ